MGWMIYDDQDKPICNFKPVVTAFADFHTDSECEPIPYVKLKLDFGGNQHSRQFTIPLSQLDNVRWMDKDARCRFCPEAPPGKVKRYLADAVRTALPVIPTEKVYFLERVGVHDIGGEKVFCTGGGILRPPASIKDGPVIELKPMECNLDIDQGLSEAQAVAGMLELVSIAPDPGRIILAHKLLYIMRQVYKEVWKAPCVCVYLHGQTGTKKTTYSTILTQMYNRGNGIISPARLNSSIAAAVGILMEKHDDTVILDDLCPADSNHIRGQQEETLIEVTRFIADGTIPARMRGKHLTKEPPECGVLFTAEYVIGIGSDAARLLPVEMTPPDNGKLKYFQDNPLIVSTFYHGFIKWFIANYDEIRDILTEWLAAYRKVNLGAHDRLQETHFFLNTSYAMLLQYCFDKGFISEQDAAKLHHSFLELLTALVRNQDERVKQSKFSAPEKEDYLARIQVLYRSNRFVIADNAKLYVEGIHEGVIHNNCLWLRGEKLKGFFPGIELTDITDSLLAHGALKTSKSSRTNQISSLRGKRFYAIYLEKLQ